MLRYLSDAGRLYIPRNLGRTLGLIDKDCLEITIEYGSICLKKFDKNMDINKAPYVGIIRQIDYLNKISIPKDYLCTLEIAPNTALDLVLDGKTLRLSKL